MHLPWKKTGSEAQSSVPEPVTASPEQGLSSAQAEERLRLGYANTPLTPPGKTVKQIILSNVFTFYNILFFVMAGLIIAVKSWNNLMFMGVVLINMGIGIVQELRSKRTLDRLNLLTAPRASVIRDGREQSLEAALTVRDDVVIFRGGDQIYADAVLLTGLCHVNESLITGEADEIEKRPGDALLSGSFLVSGECRARLTAVGADSYAGRLSLAAKHAAAPKQSGMMRSLTRLVKWIGIAVIPLGVLVFLKETFRLGRGFSEGIVSTVAALVGVIPQGLYLLTTLTLAASVLRLAERKTLVHELSCVETLARVDTFCVDKTGTITEDAMAVEALCPLDRCTAEEAERILADYVGASGDRNATMAALREHYGRENRRAPAAALDFSSAKKYGGISFGTDGTYLLGAPEILLGERCGAYGERIAAYTAKGCRVLLLAEYAGSLSDAAPEATAVRPLALIALRNRIRPEAAATFRYFAEQGVTVKVISGDNPQTVSCVAAQAGIRDAERFVDARTLTDGEKLAEAAEKFTVFGRVTPEQKKQLVLALREKGHTVAMTGDGVNDVLALKEADCSVAMASGSDAACRVSSIVLLRSDFSVMPQVVAEGRRVINNIERSATLFLLKHIFHFLFSLTTLIFALPYPFTAAQLSLVSALTAGFPAFVLAMEPNESLVKGRFLKNVLRNALPPALTDYVLLLGVLLSFRVFSLDTAMQGTVCAIVMGIVGICVILRISRPYTPLRRLLIAAVCAAFAFSTIVLKRLFTLTPLDPQGRVVLAVFALLAWPALRLAFAIRDRLLQKRR